MHLAPLVMRISHVNEWTFFPAVYQKMATCFATEFTNSPEMTWNQKEGNAKALAFWENFNEFIADNGNAEITIAALEAQGLAGTEKGLEVIQSQLVEYCREKPGRHPSGKFRIEVGYRANPAVSNAFCHDFRPQPVTCTPDGRFPQH